MQPLEKAKQMRMENRTSIAKIYVNLFESYTLDLCAQFRNSVSASIMENDTGNKNTLQVTLCDAAKVPSPHPHYSQRFGEGCGRT